MNAALFYTFFIHALLFSCVSFASDDWIACKTPSECTIGEEQCYSPIAINKKFLKANEENNERQRPLIQCIEYKGPPRDNLKAICRDKKCILDKTPRECPTEKMPSPWQRCSKTTDCISIYKRCASEPINKNFQKTVFEWLEVCGACDASAIPRLSAICVKGVCELDPPYPSAH